MNKNRKKLFSLATLLKLLLISGITAANPFHTVKDGDLKVGDKDVKVITLTNDQFKQMVFNYDKNKEWKYEGKIPAIIDFYASWCPPCRELSPLVEQVAKEYSGKIVVYKVDTDQEKLLSQHLGITGLPTLLFIPVKGEPQVSMGFIPKETIVKNINSVLLVK